MIEVMLFVGVLLVIVAIWFFCGRVDNTYCLEFKESVDKRFQRYARMEPYGDKLSRVSALVVEVGRCCDEIAVCNRVWDAKRGAMYAQQLAPLLDELKRLGFFEKTQDDTDEKEVSA